MSTQFAALRAPPSGPVPGVPVAKAASDSEELYTTCSRKNWEFWMSSLCCSSLLILDSMVVLVMVLVPRKESSAATDSEESTAPIAEGAEG